MSIKENWPKIKYHARRGAGTVGEHLQFLGRDDIWLVLVLVLFGLMSFGLGKLSMAEKGKKPITFETPNLASALTAVPSTLPVGKSGEVSATTTPGLLVAAKTGKKYYYPWCTGASRIAEKNKVWFDSVEAARVKGYTPSATCKGLK